MKWIAAVALSPRTPQRAATRGASATPGDRDPRRRQADSMGTRMDGRLMVGRPLQIAGAGPAGLAAAIHAARHGAHVVVHERHTDVGARFHDDLQGLENWSDDRDVLEELEAAGIRPTFDHVAVREQVCFDAYGREYTFRSARPFYYLVRRGAHAGTLDCDLRDQALAAGVEIRYRESVDHLPEGGVVARGPRQGDIIAVGYVFDTDAANGFYGVLDDRLAPQGYGYLLIQNGHGTLATCMFARFHEERTCLERTVEFFRDKVGMRMEHPRRFGGIGAFASGRLSSGGPQILVGEASGLQDALWGFGMRYAMRSGVLAARRLGRIGDPRRDRLAERYLVGLYRAGAVNRYVYSRLGSRGYSLFLRLLARSADPRVWLQKRYAPSIWKSIVAPIVMKSFGRRVAPACGKEGCDGT